MEAWRRLPVKMPWERGCLTPKVRRITILANGAETEVLVESWHLNVAALLLGTIGVWLLALALLWRIGSWHVSPAASLTLDEGLRIGASALQIAAYTGQREVHLSFLGRSTFLVFGSRQCDPCRNLVVAATTHPATRSMRRVYVGDSETLDIDPDHAATWELYRLHNERKTREMWRAPVSPYFYVINLRGTIVAKGVASHTAHLDRLLSLTPETLTRLSSDSRTA